MLQNQRNENHIPKFWQKMKLQRFWPGFFGLVLIPGTLYLYMDKFVSQYPENQICENVYIGQVNVSGMNQQEALVVMQAYLAEARTAKMTLKAGEKATDTTLENIDLDFRDIEQTVKNAVSFGNEGSLWKRYRSIKKVLKEKFVLDEEFVINEDKLREVMENQAVPLMERAENASITRTKNGFEITEEKEGQTVDVEKSVAAVENFLNNGWNYKDFEIGLVQEKEIPTIKAEYLKEIQDELGSYSTNAGGGVRWKNLETGVGKVDGTIVMPGEQVSVHELTAPYDAEHGYVAAGSYENGQVVETYGGGICQVSSTLYNALLYAELEIVERYPHSMLVSYVEPSRDAAIAGDYKDLVFRNNYDTPVFIEGKIDESNQLRFTIYGKETRKARRKVEYESEIISTNAYQIVYKADPEAELGAERYEGSPHDGQEAKLWKIIYDNGEEIKRVEVNYSSYQKSNQIIYIGTKSDNLAATVHVKNAIATQDLDRIRAAVQEAEDM